MTKVPTQAQMLDNISTLQLDKLDKLDKLARLWHVGRVPFTTNTGGREWPLFESNETSDVLAWLPHEAAGQGV